MFCYKNGPIIHLGDEVTWQSKKYGRREGRVVALREQIKKHRKYSEYTVRYVLVKPKTTETDRWPVPTMIKNYDKLKLIKQGMVSCKREKIV